MKPAAREASQILMSAWCADVAGRIWFVAATITSPAMAATATNDPIESRPEGPVLDFLVCAVGGA